MVDHFTFHMYSLGNGPKLDPARLNASFLSAASLDKCGDGVRALWRALEHVRSPSSPSSSSSPSVWAGETAAANNGGQSGVTDTYIDSFWYLDQLM